jgi:multidrug efflux pump subunit AcrB
MNIAARFIKRPVLAAVINIVISVLGFVSLRQVSIREYPDIERKTISVSMEYAGASVPVVESQIAYKFEEALASLQGLKNMRSTITQGMCQIQLEFDSSQSINDSANNVASS